MSSNAFALLFAFYVQIFMLQFFQPLHMGVWYLQFGLWIVFTCSLWKRWRKTYVWFISLLVLNYWYISHQWYGRMLVYGALILFLQSIYTGRPSYYAASIFCAAFTCLNVQLQTIDQLRRASPSVSQNLAGED